MSDAPSGLIEGARSPHGDRGPAIASALFGALLFLVSLNGTYIYDDNHVVRQDERITDPAHWPEIWTRQYMIGAADNLYRPLVSMSYAIQWWLHGDRAWAFHLVNVMLHAGVCALVAELARRLAGVRVAWIAGLLFAAHPIHSEAVANIVGRAELMCAAGMLGAMVLILHRPMTPARVAAMVTCFLVALLSKEQGMLLPFMLFVLWLACGRGPQPIGPREKAAVQWLVVSMCFIFAGYIVMRESLLGLKFWWAREFLDWTQQPMIKSAGSDRYVMPLVLLGRYAALLVAPVILSIDYGEKVIGWQVNYADLYLYLGIAAVVLWIVLMIVAIARGWRVAIFCLFSLALSYGLISNLVSLIGTNFGERLMYLPSVFFVILIALALARLPRAALMPVMCVLVVLGSVRTFTYAKRFNDPLEFYSVSLEEQPQSIRLHLLLADEMTKRGDWQGAKAVATRGRQVLREYDHIWFYSAVIAVELGELEEAEMFLRKAMDLFPHPGTAGFLADVIARRAATRPAPTATRSTTVPSD